MSGWLRSTPSTTLHLGGRTLRRWRDADIEPLLAAVADSMSELRPWLPWSEGYDLNSARTFIDSVADSWRERSGFIYAVVDADGAILGSCGLEDRLEPGQLELGYWIRTGHTGRGHATLAAAALTSAGLQLGEVGSVEIHCDQANERSAQIPRRLGFELIEHRAKDVTAPGETGVDLVWRMSEDALPASPLARVLDSGTF